MGSSFQQPGEVGDFIAPTGGVVAGTPIMIGNLPVIPLDTTAQTLPFRGMVCGVHSVPKAASQAWTVGAIVYLDNTAHVATTVSTANFRLGVAWEAVGGTAGEVIGKVRLNGIGITAVGGAAP